MLNGVYLLASFEVNCVKLSRGDLLRELWDGIVMFLAH